MKEYLQSLAKTDMRKYGPAPFWSWNNKLEKSQLLHQIDKMKEGGCGGFVIHARTGLRIEYLSEEWFSLVEACLDKAAALKMSVWIYDENGWPSGFVGGKLLEKEEYRAPFLEMEEKDAYDPAAYAVFDAAGKRLRAGEKAEGGKYRCVYVRRSPANTDILNPDVVSEFIRLTHEEYYRRFGSRFGKELVGFSPTSRSTTVGARLSAIRRKSFGKSVTAKRSATASLPFSRTTRRHILSESAITRCSTSCTRTSFTSVSMTGAARTTVC